MTTLVKLFKIEFEMGGTGKEPTNQNPPFSKEIAMSAENLAQAYRSCPSVILKQLPTTIQQKMTISKTKTVTKDDRKLHTLTVIAPPKQSNL